MRTLCCALLMTIIAVASSSAQGVSGENRPALPTFYGDTGLWFVPTAETLPSRGWSTSVYRANFDLREGLTDVAQIGVTAAFGVSDRLEIFGSWRVVRLDRTVRPVFVPTDPVFGGVSLEYPYLRRGWSKTLGGPVSVGAKWNFISQSRNDAMALAARAMVSFPAGSPWASTNKVTGQFDVIASREFNRQVELTATAGAMLRQKSDDFKLSDGAKWGLGASFPSRSRLRALVEWQGEWVINANTELRAPPFVAEDGSIAPLLSRIHDPANVKVGAVFQGSRGWFVHGGANYSAG